MQRPAIAPLEDFFNNILSNPNVEVLYASATFAKRPDNMALYFRTNLSQALDDQDSLVSVLTRGGVPLQQVLSQGLASDGQYIRRERDFTGVTFDLVMADPVNKATGEVDKTAKADLITTYDRYANVLRDLVDYSAYVKTVVTEGTQDVYGVSGTNESVTVGMATFASSAHNFIAQLILASKCDICVQQALKAFKKGQKPVIALYNTLEKNLTEFAEAAGVNVGDRLPMRYAHILENAVWRMYHYTVPNGVGGKEVITFESSRLWSY